MFDELKKITKNYSKAGKQHSNKIKNVTEDFPGGLVVKNPLVNAGDTGLIPGLGRFHMIQSN